MQRRATDVALVCDSAAGLSALSAALRARGVQRPSREAQFTAYRSAVRSQVESVQPQVGYLDVIRQALPPDGFFVEEICQAGFTARYAFPVFQPRTYVSCGYQDNLGFGYMTALGVKAANPDKPVISISGDGGFLFGVQELATAAQQGLGVVAIVFNNRAFGNVLRDQQQSFGGRLIGAELCNPDFVQLAHSFGITAHRVASPAELAALLPQALLENRPVLIEIPLERGSEASPWPFIHK